MLSLVSRIRLWHILLLAFLLLTPTLFDGLINDDYFHYFLLSDNPPLTPVNDGSLWGLFSFANQDAGRNQQLINIGIMPWWVSGEFSWRFFRPLTEASLYIDHVWLRDHLMLMHLHSVLLYLLLIALAYAFFGLLIARQDFRLLATLLFAIDGAHGVTVAWLSARSMLLAGIFILAFILSHHRAIQPTLSTLSRRIYGVLALLAFAASLFTAEAGVVAGVYLLSYNLFLDKRCWTQRFLHMLPYAAIAAVWLGIYLHGHYGVIAGSDFYLSPNQQPLAFAQRFAEITLLTGFAFWTSLPTDFYSANAFTPVFLLLGVMGISLGFWVFRRHPERPVIAFLVLCSLLSFVPIAGAPLQGRNLLISNLSLAPLMALAILMVLDRWRQQKAFARTALVFLLLTQMVLNLLWQPLYSRSLAFIEQTAVNRAKTLSYTENDQLVLVSTRIGETLYLAPRLLYLNGKLPHSLWNLTGEAEDAEITVQDEHTIRLTSQRGFINNWGEFVRNLKTQPFYTGQTITWDGLTIQIEALNTRGQPTVFTAQFDIPVAQLRFFKSEAHQFVELDILDQSQ